ncbi:hypothetical protein D3C78_1718880 [compost metagenome]
MFDLRMWFLVFSPRALGITSRISRAAQRPGLSARGIKRWATLALRALASWMRTASCSCGGKVLIKRLMV